MQEYNKWIDRLPSGLRIRRLWATICAELSFPQGACAGHFYSPIPRREEIEHDQDRIFRQDIAQLPEIDLQAPAQFELLGRLAAHARSLDISANATPGKRFHSANPYFYRADALVLGSMLLEFKPRHYLEIGSGFSSALALDVNDACLGGSVQFSFVEPSPTRLRLLINQRDGQTARIYVRRVQEVPDETFASLEPNDFLFVDGSHVAKVGSDLNDVIFRILPLLKPGVIIHFHDIPRPFEYAKETVMRGTSWNETYILRAFLANNSKYQILFFPSWLEKCHATAWHQAFSGIENIKVSSFWLRKV